MTFETIETTRLLLRKMTDEDYRAIFEQLPDSEIMRLLNIPDTNKLEIERAKQQKGYSTYNRKLLIFHILDKQTNELIGWCGFHTWYTDHARAEIGYALTDESRRSKGIMSEALKAILDYGFEKMQLNRVEALASPENVPSLRLLERSGFKKEGLMRKHYFTGGRFEDSVVFGLLKDEGNIT